MRPLLHRLLSSGPFVFLLVVASVTQEFTHLPRRALWRADSGQPRQVIHTCMALDGLELAPLSGANVTAEPFAVVDWSRTLLSGSFPTQVGLRTARPAPQLPSLPALLPPQPPHLPLVKPSASPLLLRVRRNLADEERAEQVGADDGAGSGNDDGPDSTLVMYLVIVATMMLGLPAAVCLAHVTLQARRRGRLAAAATLQVLVVELEDATDAPASSTNTSTRIATASHAASAHADVHIEVETGSPVAVGRPIVVGMHAAQGSSGALHTDEERSLGRAVQEGQELPSPWSRDSNFGSSSVPVVIVQGQPVGEEEAEDEE